MESDQAGAAQAQNLLTDSYISFVNLKHREDRLFRMQETLTSRNITAVRQEGLYPRDVTDKIQPAARLQVMQKRTPGAIGCHFSQVAIMEEALRQKKHAWVMEDDLKICPDIHERLAYMDRFIATHRWDILWMGGTFHINPPHWHKTQNTQCRCVPAACPKRDAECTDDPRMMRTYGAFCTYSYIVNRDSLSLVLEGLDRYLDRSMGIDWAMIQMQPHLHTYAFVPGCMTQYDNQSDIGKGMTIFSAFKKLGPYWFANHMADFDPMKYNWHEATTPTPLPPNA